MTEHREVTKWLLRAPLKNITYHLHSMQHLSLYCSLRLIFSKLQLFSHDLIVLCSCTNTRCKFVSIKQIWHFIQIVKERWFFITISNFWEVFVIESIPKCSTSFHIHREIQSELYYWLDIVYCKTNVIVDSTMNNAVRVPFTMKM